MNLLVFTSVSWHPPGREQPVFTGLDLELAAGELTVLTSGLGGGKSSALRLAVGLEQPSSGEIRVCDRSPASVRDRIGYVASEGALLANLSLYDNLVLPLRWLRDPTAAEVARRASEALAAFGIDSLPAIAPAYAPTNLRRLVALARALIMEPAVMLLDDPTAEFDTTSANELWEHLADLARDRGIAVLAAATDAPALPRARVIGLSGTSVPATRRFSPSQRRTGLLPALRGAVHPDILTAKQP